MWETWPKIFLRKTGTGKMLTFPPPLLSSSQSVSLLPPPYTSRPFGGIPLYYFLLFCILFSTCLWTLLPNLKKKDREVSLPLLGYEALISWASVKRINPSPSNVPYAPRSPRWKDKGESMRNKEVWTPRGQTKPN